MGWCFYIKHVAPFDDTMTRTCLFCLGTLGKFIKNYLHFYSLFTNFCSLQVKNHPVKPQPADQPGSIILAKEPALQVY